MAAQSLPDGQLSTTFDLLAAEPFRSLAISLRLIYMEGEPAQYFHVCNVLYPVAGDAARSGIALCRERYKTSLEGSYVRFNLHGIFEGQSIGPRGIFEAWLYGLVFHQDHDRRPLLEELSKYQGGLGFPFAVQMVGLRLAGVVLDLDDIVATVLGEPQVPRIAPSASDPPAEPPAV